MGLHHRAVGAVGVVVENLLGRIGENAGGREAQGDVAGGELEVERCSQGQAAVGARVLAAGNRP